MRNKKPGLIAAEWDLFRETVIPSEAPLIQIQECRRAFYAGVSALFTILIENTDPTKEPTDADVKEFNLFTTSLIDSLTNDEGRRLNE